MGDVRLVDLDVFKRYSLAIRQESAPVEEVLAVLEATRRQVERADAGPPAQPAPAEPPDATAVAAPAAPAEPPDATAVAAPAEPPAPKKSRRRPRRSGGDAEGGAGTAVTSGP